MWRVERNPARYQAMLRWSHQYGPISNATRLAEVMAPISDREDQENAWMVMLDTHGFLRGIDLIARGGRSSVAVPLDDALRAAIGAGSRYTALIHNHPSGNPTPSDADVGLTGELAGACDEVRLLLLDHVIMGAGQFYSFREGTQWRTSLLTP